MWMWLHQHFLFRTQLLLKIKETMLKKRREPKKTLDRNCKLLLVKGIFSDVVAMQEGNDHQEQASNEGVIEDVNDEEDDEEC